MTDPKAKAMSVEEAVDCLRQNAPWIEEADTPQMILERDTHLAALATLEAVVKENAALKQEAGDLKKAIALCDYVIDPIRAEREAWSVFLKSTDYTEEQRNIILETIKSSLSCREKEEKWSEAEAELARYRRYDPLIEAAEKATILRLTSLGVGPPPIEYTKIPRKDRRAILRAALKCREEKTP